MCFISDRLVDSIVDELNEKENQCPWPTGQCLVCPVATTLTPSEIALARVLSAWDEWPGPASKESPSYEESLLRFIGAKLCDFGYASHVENELSKDGKALLDRAKKAGVV